MDDIHEPQKIWGGSWTERKLEAFEKYVKAYLSIMGKNQYWKTVYFDAFAGSGEKEHKTELYKQLSIIEEEEKVYRGAAERVVSFDKKFDWYYFIDKNKKDLKLLEKKLSDKYPNMKNHFAFRADDCNTQLKKLAKASNEKKLASLIFLDPFGMQVNWESIKTLSGTKSDIWILIPTGVIVNRLLDKKGELKNIKKLEVFFGLEEEIIRKEFYKKRIVKNLFDEDSEIVKKIMDPINKIANLYISNLKNIWEFVTPNPLRLSNSKGSPIFHFVFASNNKNTVKIAQQIIENT
jgi:three-Cys-motif partner protein